LLDAGAFGWVVSVRVFDALMYCAKGSLFKAFDIMKVSLNFILSIVRELLNHSFYGELTDTSYIACNL
jgi:hypothetical protein